MKPTLLSILLVAVFCSLTASSLRADGKDDLSPTVAASQETNIPVSQEFTMEGGYTGASITKQGDAKLGGVSNINSHFDYVVSPQIRDGVLLRFGVDTERNSFGLFSGAPLPNTLQSFNAIIGTDLALGDKTIMRFELHPGIYSDFLDVTGSDFDMPVQIGGTYLWSKDFQIIFGIQIDLKSNYPVIGLPGFRWQFADKWALSAIPPKPQLQYEVNNALTLYTGAEILGGTYHLNKDFGSNHGHGPDTNNSQLNNNICDFTELRVGAGLTWKFTPNFKLDVSGGYMPYRDFDMHQDKIGYDTHSTSFRNDIGDGAPYAEAGISGSF
jgi:opacity protein-like surface antigen